MTYAPDERRKPGLYDGVEPPSTYQQNWARRDRIKWEGPQFPIPAKPIIKPPAVPLCYTYVRADGSWGNQAYPAWGVGYGSRGDERLIAAIRGTAIALSIGDTSIQAIAVRMSDDSLVIIRPKVRP